MKKILILAIALVSLSLFASDSILSVDGLRELSRNDISNLQDALIIANNGKTQYGNCGLNLDWFTSNNTVQVFVDDNSVNPLIVAFSDTEWIKINSDQTSTKIVSASYGQYTWTKINLGTLIKPNFQTVRTITSNSNCN